MEVVEVFVGSVTCTIITIIIIDVDFDDDDDDDISKLALTRSRLRNSSFDRKSGLGQSAPFSASSGESRLASSLNCLFMRR